MMNVAANTALDVTAEGHCALFEANINANTNSAVHTDCSVGSDGGNYALVGGDGTDICNGGTNTAASDTASQCEKITGVP